MVDMTDLSDLDAQLNGIIPGFDLQYGQTALRGSIDAFPTLAQGGKTLDSAMKMVSPEGVAAKSNATPEGSGVGISGSSTVGDYFVRAVVVVLGFIFVAVGLSMFRVPIVSEVVGKAK